MTLFVTTEHRCWEPEAQNSCTRTFSPKATSNLPPGESRAYPILDQLGREPLSDFHRDEEHHASSSWLDALSVRKKTPDFEVYPLCAPSILSINNRKSCFCSLLRLLGTSHRIEPASSQRSFPSPPYPNPVIMSSPLSAVSLQHDCLVDTSRPQFDHTYLRGNAQVAEASA